MFHTLPGLVVWLATPALNKLNQSHSHVPIIKIVTLMWTRHKFSISGWSNLITACPLVTSEQVVTHCALAEQTASQVCDTSRWVRTQVLLVSYWTLWVLIRLGTDVEVCVTHLANCVCIKAQSWQVCGRGVEFEWCNWGSSIAWAHWSAALVLWCKPTSATIVASVCRQVCACPNDSCPNGSCPNGSLWITCQCLFSITSRKAQLRAPLSPLQTTWTTFSPYLYTL